MQALWEAEEFEHYLERTQEQVKFEMLMVPTVLTPFKGVSMAVT